MQDWYPEAIIDLGNDAGSYTDLGEPKGLLHTTEGKTYSSARSAYVTKNAWPHFTATYENSVFKIYQHNKISVASRALRNETGGVQTNRDNVVQIELVGTADRTNESSWGSQYVVNFPKPYLDGIGKWMRWVEKQKGVPRRCTVTFKTYPESYGNNGVRLSGAAWDAYSGWLGHMHAPENVHGDPGLIDMTYLLNVGVPQEDWLDMVTKAEFEASLKTYTSAWLVRPKKEDGTIMSNVFVVAADFSSKFWIGDWGDVGLLDFLENLNDAGTDATGKPKPFNFDWHFVQQIPEQWNPALGCSFAPLPVDKRWQNTPPPR